MRRHHVAWLRDIDRWLIQHVLPSAADYLRLAKRLVGTDEADDIVQEAYARLVAYDRWRDVANPRALCLRAVRNIGIDRLRSADVVHIDRLSAVESIDLSDDQPDAFRVVAGRDFVERLVALIDALPPQRGRVVRMRKIEGRAPQEIAVTLGISVSTVEKHLAKGLLAIADGLDGAEAGNVVKSRPWARRRDRT